MDIPAWREKNLARNLEENDKKSMWSLAESEREKKVLKSFEKVCLNKSNLIFLKLDSRVLIDQKSVSIDRNRQRLTKNFKCNFN